MKKRTLIILAIACVTVFVVSVFSSPLFMGDELDKTEISGEEDNEDGGGQEESESDELRRVEKPVEIDYDLTPEEILLNYTEEGMNQFKMNFPDTLTMFYALKHIGRSPIEIEGVTMEGEQISLSDFNGHNVIVGFSKTTCSACSEMASVLAQLGEIDEDLTIIHVFPVDQNKDVLAFYEANNMDVPENTLTFEDNEHLKEVAMDEYGIEQVPTYIFIDDSNRISYTYIGNKDFNMFHHMTRVAFGEDKIYDHVRSTIIQLDEDGNEIEVEDFSETEIVGDDEVVSDEVDEANSNSHE